MLTAAFSTSRAFGITARLAAGAVAALAFASHGQDTGVPKTLTMTRLDEAPVIDGRLDEPAWSRATVVDDFYQVQPMEFAPGSEEMRVYVYYDDDALYVGAEIRDSEPDSITANILRQGELINNEDEFVVILDPFNDQRSGYRFETNPNGIRNDGIYENGTQMRWDWDGIWSTAAMRTSQGWTAEMAIPFKTLSFDPANDTWGINFSRNVARKGERIGWVSRNRNQNATITGSAVGMTGMQQGMGLDVVPSITVNKSKLYVDSADGADIRDRDAEPSLDVFYKITPGLNASLTINTDFSATEVDDRQVNLTRFGLFFPEKRDFFLKDADIFEFGRIASNDDSAFSDTTLQNGRPFFSRRIGLSALGEPVDLQYGGKVSGRIGRWSLGTLAIRQEDYPGVPAADLFVGRAALNVLEESSVGMIVTSGDARSTIDNELYGVDFRYVNTRLPGGRVLQSEAWFQQTRTGAAEGTDATDGTGGGTDGIDGGGVPPPSGDGSAAGFRIATPNNTGWRGAIGLKELEANFNPALGFVDRADIRDMTIEAGYTLRPDRPQLIEVYAGLAAQRIDLLDGRLQSQLLQLRLVELQSRGSDYFRLRFEKNKEALFERFEISDGKFIEADTYSFDRYRVEIGSGEQRRFSAKLALEGGDFFDGERTDARVDFAWKPSRHFQARVGYEVNKVDLPAGEFTVRLGRLGLDVVFSSTLSWVNLLQYDNVSEIVGFNSRLHWIPEAGRETFFVINHNLEDVGENDSFHTLSGDVTAKIGYTFRF